jgi:hypothetical protein
VERSPAAGLEEGGGIWNDVIGGPGFPQVAKLDLIDSSVCRESARCKSWVDRLGGGVFAGSPVSLTNSVIAGNSPDQCSGSDCPQLNSR